MKVWHKSQADKEHLQEEDLHQVKVEHLQAEDHHRVKVPHHKVIEALHKVVHKEAHHQATEDHLQAKVDLRVHHQEWVVHPSRVQETYSETLQPIL
jgi:hypothetical protein